MASMSREILSNLVYLYAHYTLFQYLWFLALHLLDYVIVRIGAESLYVVQPHVCEWSGSVMVVYLISQVG